MLNQKKEKTQINKTEDGKGRLLSKPLNFRDH